MLSNPAFDHSDAARAATMTTLDAAAPVHSVGPLAAVTNWPASAIQLTKATVVARPIARTSPRATGASGPRPLGCIQPATFTSVNGRARGQRAKERAPEVNGAQWYAATSAWPPLRSEIPRVGPRPTPVGAGARREAEDGLGGRPTDTVHPDLHRHLPSASQRTVGRRRTLCAASAPTMNRWEMGRP